MTTPIQPAFAPVTVIDFSSELAATPPVIGTEAKKALDGFGLSRDPHRVESWFVSHFGGIDKLTPAQAAKLAGELQALDLGYAANGFAGALASYANAYTNLVRLLAVRDFSPERNQRNIEYWASGAFGDSDTEHYSYNSSNQMTQEKSEQLLALLAGVQADPRWLLDDATRATLAKLIKQATGVREAHRLITEGDGGEAGPFATALAYFDKFVGGLDKLTEADSTAAMTYIRETARREDPPSKEIASSIAYTAYCLVDVSLKRRPSTVDGWQEFFTKGLGGRDLTKSVGIVRAAEVVSAIMRGHDESQLPLIRTAADRVRASTS